MKLENLGWNSAWANAFEAANETGFIPGRVIQEHREAYVIITEWGERQANVSGRFRHQAQTRWDFPAVGDWVAAEVTAASSRAVIHSVLPRKSAFARRLAGTKAGEQVVAANIDKVLIVSGLDHDFNLRRIERYLILAYESGAEPVIVLNKADMRDDPEAAKSQVETVAHRIPVLLISARTKMGLDSLLDILKPGETGALLGSSGVGKSTIINALIGSDVIPTAAVREDDSRGRHTTTRRELVPLPGGAALIDNPGMREIQIIAGDASFSRSFDEISTLGQRCRYKDCTHLMEPGCAVREALANGELDKDRYESYLSHRKEIRHHQIEQDIHLKIKEKKRWKAIYRSMRYHHKRRDG